MKKLLALILLLASFGATSQTIQGTALRITSLNGIMQGNGTTNASAISNSSTVGQVFRVTGASTYGWGALDLSDSDAITGSLPTASIAGITTVGTNLLTVPNPSAIRFFNIAADNSITLSTAADFRTAIGVTPVTFGSATRIPYMNAGGTDFSYSGDFTFLAKTLDVNGEVVADTVSVGTIFQRTNVISLNTSDGSDNSELSLAGGGSNGITRGATVRLFGNEAAVKPGILQLFPGSTASTGIEIYDKNGDISATVGSTGNWDFEGNAITDAIGSGITGLPISTGVSGLGTGVATALAVNTGTAGSFVVNGGALGTPSSGTVTNLTGTASININGTVGATTPNTGAFTSTTNTLTGIFNNSVHTTSHPNTVGLSVKNTTLDGIGVISQSNTAAVGGSIISARSRDTSGSPLVVNSGDVLGAWFGRGYATSQWSGAVAGIRFVTEENFTNTANGTGIDFGTTSIGSTSRTIRWTINSSGHLVPTGSVTLGITGTRVSNIYTTNQTTTNAETVDSDSTLKTNIHSIVNATEKIKQLNPVEYTWRADSLNKVHYGLIAQDVQSILPEVVTKREESGTLGVAYTELIPYLIQTIKELEARVSELENE